MHITAEPQCARNIDWKELESDPQARAPLITDVLQPLLHIRARVQVCVGTASLTVAELLNARCNQVIALDRQIDQPVDLLIEGKVIARGQLIAVDDHFAVRITDAPTAPGF